MFAAIKKFFCIFIVVCLLPLGLLAGCSKENAEAPEEPKKILEIATSLSGLKGSVGLDADEKALRTLYNAGFRYINFSMGGSLGKNSVFMSDNWREEALKLKTLADQLGMKFVMAHSPSGNLLSTDQKEVDELLAATKRSIEICEVLGIKNTVVHAGWREGLNKKQWFRMNMLLYYNLLPTAEKCGVNILCENSTTKNMTNWYYIITGAEMREFVEYVNHPNFHACWDTGHANCDGLDQYQNILDIGDELYGIHYTDNMGDADSHLMPFFGTLNHNDVMRALTETEYNGYFTLECGSRIPGEYKGPEFPWMIEAFPNVPEKNRSLIPQMMTRLQKEKLLFDIASYIVTTYPTETPQTN